ncbi:hypothetical protein CBR_g31158 [Chara braunii]|uniref:Uncharacterized protein n=1 Tax=Chara braunii TaxID=69332 RepID=A0A388LEH7_CHABU|nr:hypothetical protein CBR_g31158 [Chara braunii]|eukprot:GBG80701.1 hypothetical protein CBR_g31158 [Chara braunii]
MVNSRESSPDWLHDFKAPASAPVNISSSSTSESYGVPSWSAGEVNEGKRSRPRKIDRQDVSSDDEPVSKFKRQSSSQEINEEASGQKRDLLSSEAKVKTQAKKRTRTDAGLESGGDGDDSAKKNGVHGNGDVSWNGQREDGSAAKRKKVEGRGRGRGEGGGGRGRGAGRGRSALGADKKLGGEAKKGGVIAKVDEGKGRGRGTAGPETGVQKQVGLDKWLSTKPAMPAPPLQDTAKGQPLLNVKKESGITHDAVTKNELNDMVCVDGGRLETKAAVKREPLGGIKDAARWMQNDMGDEKPAEKKVTGGGEKKGREEMRTAGIKEVKMELKRGDREFSEAVTDADAMVEEEGDEEDGTKGADAAEDLKKKGKVKVLSRLPLMLPEKISRTKVKMMLWSWPRHICACLGPLHKDPLPLPPHSLTLVSEKAIH